MSTDKLSELSKPVAWTDERRNLCTYRNKERGLESRYHQDYEKYTTPLYSQEYVSALLADNEYMRWRIKEIDLLFGQMLLTMQAAVIEIEHGEGPNAAMAWIVNKLAGPGEFAPDSEKDAQAYFNRESEKIDVEYSKCMDFFESRRKALKEQSNG